MTNYPLSDYIYLILSITICFLSIIGNAFLIHVVRKRKQFHTPTFILLANQAASDILLMIVELLKYTCHDDFYHNEETMIIIIIKHYCSTLSVLWLLGIK